MSTTLDTVMDIIAPQSAIIEPEQFQSQLIDNISAALLGEVCPPCLLRAPTGAGKTFILSKVLERVTTESPTLWFWFVPFVNLVQQTEDAIAGNTHGLTPVSLLRGRNQAPAGGLVVISTAQSVARAKSRREGYTDGDDDTTRNLDAQVTLARARGLKIGLVVDEAHIGLDSQTEFGQFARWLRPDRLIMATATPKDDRLMDFISKAGYSAFETFAVARDDVVDARLNKRYIEAVVYDLRQSVQSVADLQQTVLRQAWKRSQRLKAKLEKMGIPVVPLLLVQVSNGASAVADARKQLMQLCNVAPSAIGEHSSDEPDPVLMASIANDSTKEVLIFKQSAGTGFDAPRAFVLASTKPVNDSDFAAQFIGRIMRVHRAIRTHFARPQPIDAELNTAYVYLANAEAQQGFEQAVVATANLRTQLEGQCEKLVARKMASGAVVYTNRETDSTPLFFDTPMPTGQGAGRPPASSWPTLALGSTPDLPGVVGSDELDAELDRLEPVAQPSGLQSGPGMGARASLPAPVVPKVRTLKDLTQRLSEMGLRVYPRRSGIESLPPALKSEQRPEMSNMATASRAAATRLEISPQVQKMAVAIALGKVREREIHTELTTHERQEQTVVIVVERAVLAREALQALHTLPQVEEEDEHIIIDILSRRMKPQIEADFMDADAPMPEAADLKRMCRDAAFAVIRREHEALAEILHEEISAQAESVDAGPLPHAMLFAFDITLESSAKNIFGVMPPSKDDVTRLQQVLTIDARSAMGERTVPLAQGDFMMAPYDGAHAFGIEERAFAKALDRADFVHWWHRNPDRKSYSMRIMRGEHKNYFYPDFVVCLEHFPGDEPLQRLIETKESLKDAARKSRRASPVYGKVLFMTKDLSKWRFITMEGTMGAEIDMDDLIAVQEWLRASVPALRS